MILRCAQQCECTKCHTEIQLNVVKIVCFIKLTFAPIYKKRVENQNNSGYCIFILLFFFYESKTTKTIVSLVTVVIAIAI